MTESPSNESFKPNSTSQITHYDQSYKPNARRSEEALKSAMMTMVEGAKRVRSELQNAMQVRADIDDLIHQASNANVVLA